MTRAVLRKELTVLWVSPVPYMAGALFHVVLGLLYVDQLAGRRQAVIQPLFPIAGFLLLLLVPLIAMRTMAEEIRSGTLDLLYVAHTRTAPLLIGKWLAVWLTSLVVIAPATLFVALLGWFGHPDLGPVLSGFSGVALMAAGLAAVGVLASSLNESQPVAAGLAAFVGVLLWFARGGPDVVGTGGLLAYLSLSERLRAFAAGVIDTGDIGFYVTAVAGALVVAALVTDGRRVAR